MENQVFVQSLRMVREDAPEPFYSQVSGAEDVVPMVQTLIGDEWQEVAIALFFDYQHRLIGYQVVGRGGLAWCPAEPREIIVAGLMANAAALIMVHNHPSGSLTPSDADKRVTAKLASACEVVGIQFLDHLVVTARGWASARKGAST